MKGVCGCLCSILDVPKHDHSTPIVVVEIDAFRHLASRHGKQYSSTPIIAGPTVILEGDAGFIGIRRFDKDELVFPDLR